jgi:Methylene-tetrahydrofolate reductase C terminal
MRQMRRWSVRHAAPMSRVYAVFERALVALDPLLRRIGYARLDRPAAVLERGIKGALFDCRMCGQCILSSTGMSCPMNCPKNLRNGPCGGVRPDGRCEVRPEMTCVWVLAFEGSRRMPEGDLIQAVQPPVDHRLWGRSAWIGLLRRGRNTAASGIAGSGALPARRAHVDEPDAPARRAA